MNHYCFDCDDTLYDLSWPFVQAMKKYFPEVFEKNMNIEQLYQEYRANGDALFDLLCEGTITTDDSGILRIVKLCRDHNLHIDVMDAWEFQKDYKDFQYKISMDPVLYKLLSDLSGKTAVLTNGVTEHQRKKLYALKADQLVDSDRIFVSSELGCRKPEARCFLSALEKMNEKPEDWFYVGDNYEIDMAGAKNAGMKTIHFNRHHTKSGPAADYVVYTESELADLIRKLEKTKAED